MSGPARGARAAMRRTSPLAALGVALALTLASAARAHVVSDRELVTLRAISPGRVRALLATDVPDTLGLAGANRPAWRSLAPQTDALYLLAEASVRSDTLLAERAWRGVELAFAHQTPEGRFTPATDAAGRARPPAEERRVTSEWAGGACRAFVALSNGPLIDRFRIRYANALPKLRRTIQWLVATAPASYAALDALTDAQTFLLGDGLYHEETLGHAGQKAIAAALAAQRADGGFGAARATDPSREARGMQCLQAVTQYFTAPSLEAALAKSARFVAKQIARDGRIVGVARTDRRAQCEVALALRLVAARSGDDALADAADRAEAAWKRERATRAP